jgi:uncharacterized BrkB/YihY/UPF0761 family membrane protein
LSFEDWLYRKAEQNAHNEILAFLMTILGMNLLVGGLLVTLITMGQLTLLPLLNQQPLSQSATLGFILTVVGFCVLSTGFVLVIHYDRERSWFIGETAKSTLYKKDKDKRPND